MPTRMNLREYEEYLQEAGEILEQHPHRGIAGDLEAVKLRAAANYAPGSVVVYVAGASPRTPYANRLWIIGRHHGEAIESIYGESTKRVIHDLAGPPAVRLLPEQDDLVVQAAVELLAAAVDPSFRQYPDTLGPEVTQLFQVCGRDYTVLVEQLLRAVGASLAAGSITVDEQGQFHIAV